VAEVVDVIQLPAFLARQTDLVVAMAKTGAAINVKKPQFLAPHEMRHIISKFAEAGNEQVMLCERGSCFGYNNLEVHRLAMDEMKTIAQVFRDAADVLQRPGGGVESADGRRLQRSQLGGAGIGLGIAGLFWKGNPNPTQAKCDG